jgi:hypothetical protein
MRRQTVVVPFSEVGHTGLGGRAYELCCDAQCEMFAGILVVKVDLKNVPYPSTPRQPTSVQILRQIERHSRIGRCTVFKVLHVTNV